MTNPNVSIRAHSKRILFSELGFFSDCAELFCFVRTPEGRSIRSGNRDDSTVVNYRWGFVVQRGFGASRRAGRKTYLHAEIVQGEFAVKRDPKSIHTFVMRQEVFGS